MYWKLWSWQFKEITYDATDELFSIEFAQMELLKVSPLPLDIGFVIVSRKVKLNFFA